MNGFFILTAYFVSSDILEYDKIQLTYLNGVSITLFLAPKKKRVSTTLSLCGMNLVVVVISLI